MDPASLGMMALGSLMSGMGKGTTITTTVEQAISQQSGISFNPVVTVSSPNAVTPSQGGEVPITAPPVSQSAATTTPSGSSGYSLLPSLSLPSGYVTGVSPVQTATGTSSKDNSLLLLMLIGAGAVFLMGK